MKQRAYKFNKTDHVGDFNAGEVYVVLATSQEEAEEKIKAELQKFYSDAAITEQGLEVNESHEVTWEFAGIIPKYLADERVVTVVK